ncbi:hypothetical protein KF913_24590 [Candidatus Obscuribacterales bacterium]|nr:hypothetical protein [Candidatus Obscuribacterales bacterium]
MSKRKRRTPRYWEQKENSQRSAWNRVGKKFRLSKEELEGAKKSGLSPYPILRKMDSYNRDSVQYYIAYGGSAAVKYDSVADYLVDREIERLTEIARLEQEGFDEESILELVGEQWW